MTVRVAGAHEAEEILRVTNAAYQVEKFFIDTDRLDPGRLGELLLKGVFLVADGMAGCVYVELRGDRAYFGPLSVEDYARAHGCRYMDMRIVNLREELPAFYRKLGYAVTGTEPFPETEPTKLPCHLIRMSKEL
jgi:hypothetical protein